MGRCSEEPLGFLDCLLLQACILKNKVLRTNPKLWCFLASSLKIITVRCFHNKKASPQVLLWMCLDDDVLPLKNSSLGKNSFAIIGLCSVVALRSKRPCSVSWSLLETFETSFLKFRQSTWDSCVHALQMRSWCYLDEMRACRFSSPKFFKRQHGELWVLRLETRVLYMRLAFGVHDLENF